MKRIKIRVNFRAETVAALILSLLIVVCEKKPTEPDPEYPDVTREEKIPEDSVKMTPETDVPSGVYLCRFENGNEIKTIKLMLIR
ncbi:hypothetical protein HQ585_16060 [candidate division KSB1 bacterium]|nr:hypothetical protein [candidate division KSB1 bacterium]